MGELTGNGAADEAARHSVQDVDRETRARPQDHRLAVWHAHHKKSCLVSPETPQAADVPRGRDIPRWAHALATFIWARTC
jgi:hypothetical protein